MDASDSAIVFDDQGVCDHCNTYYSKVLPNWHTNELGKNELDKIIRRIKDDGKKRDFDCIIGVSGGFDSSYLVHLAKQEFNLRPLVFHVDAGWNSDIAVSNIQRLIDGLGLDLFTEVIDWEEMKDLQLAFFKSGVPHVDTPQDHAFFATMYKFASKYGVKNILTGANLSTECIRNPLEWMYYQTDSKQIRDIHHKFGTMPLNSFPLTSILWHKVWLPYFRGIKVHKPLNFVPYLKEEARSTLMKNYGWKPYPQKHFESRFTKFYESYWLFKRFGYDVRKVQYSSLILTKQMSREDALNKLQCLPYHEKDIANEFEYVATKLGISTNELNQYLELPLKTYEDYRSQYTTYKIGAKIMRFIGLELGGKR
jgi:N-acetyl sugar amidotransferase